MLKALSCKVDRELFEELSMFCIHNDMSKQDVLVEALRSYLLTARKLPVELRRKGRFIYLVGVAESLAVKVGITVDPVSRLRQYKSRCEGLGYYAMWELYPQCQDDLAEVERELLGRYRCFPDGSRGFREGGWRSTSSAIEASNGQRHYFPYATEELLRMPRTEAVPVISSFLSGRGHRVL